MCDAHLLEPFLAVIGICSRIERGVHEKDSIVHSQPAVRAPCVQL